MTEPRTISRLMRGESLSPAKPAAQLLVGHDSHPASEAAVRVAADLAVRLDAHLHVVHVVGLDDTKVDLDSPHWREAEQDAIVELAAGATRLLAGADIGWSYHAGTGEPVDLLASLAVEYEVLFIVVGVTERNLYRRLTEGGSVSRKLLREYAKPVLVVPGPHTD
jgi:nucleotide-binding universal stress UspA family protein